MINIGSVEILDNHHHPKQYDASEVDPTTINRLLHMIQQGKKSISTLIAQLIGHKLVLN